MVRVKLLILEGRVILVSKGVVRGGFDIFRFYFSSRKVKCWFLFVCVKGFTDFGRGFCMDLYFDGV